MYSLNLKPIENFFAELKGFIRHKWSYYEESPDEEFGSFLEWCIDVVGAREESARGHFVSGKVSPTECAFGPNVDSSQFSTPGQNISAGKATSKVMSLLEVPGPRDEAVKMYSEWRQQMFTDDTLQAAFRQVCDVMLEDGLDIEQVYKDQDPESFLSARE